ncbi:hypothetical protein TL16_g02069 [Triparma laevis f. inornata]|uniref:EF-hand domain-containing protein n=2 Tax=Triparma laevis TaxID=1534972 RepID=A0A9W7CMY6_9STRA|nr:hypothetical protein TL16_g02069 [Triparma laevis f. inornata]GMI08848.1 hypothetical protein TrLO_g10181 [Triparma laevis f. longispina]
MAFKMLLIKGAKPVGAAVLGFAAYKGYEEWQRAGDLLKINENYGQMLQLFDKIDTDNSGSINSSELQKALNKSGMDVNFLEVKAMITPNTMDKAVEKYSEAHKKK